MPPNTVPNAPFPKSVLNRICSCGIKLTLGRRSRHSRRVSLNLCIAEEDYRRSREDCLLSCAWNSCGIVHAEVVEEKKKKRMQTQIASIARFLGRNRKSCTDSVRTPIASLFSSSLCLHAMACVKKIRFFCLWPVSFPLISSGGGNKWRVARPGDVNRMEGFVTEKQTFGYSSRFWLDIYRQFISFPIPPNDALSDEEKKKAGTFKKKPALDLFKLKPLSASDKAKLSKQSTEKGNFVIALKDKELKYKAPSMQEQVAWLNAIEPFYDVAKDGHVTLPPRAVAGILACLRC